jgi:hypothetical protein
VFSIVLIIRTPDKARPVINLFFILLSFNVKDSVKKTLHYPVCDFVDYAKAKHTNFISKMTNSSAILPNIILKK